MTKEMQRQTAEAENTAASGRQEVAHTEKKPHRRSGKKAEDAAVQEEETQQSLEEIFTLLDSLLSEMENAESLEKSFRLYKRGVELIRQANESIDRVEKQVRVLDEEGILS
ncbi:MAG: exodeoxyribonuclease VII small subunit [Oribacterium sp.]